MYRVWKVTTRWREGPKVEYRLEAERETEEAIREEARERARVIDPYDDAYGGVEAAEEPNPPADWLRKELERASAGRRELADREAWLQRRLGVAPGDACLRCWEAIRLSDTVTYRANPDGTQTGPICWRCIQGGCYQDPDGNQAERLTSLGRRLAEQLVGPVQTKKVASPPNLDEPEKLADLEYGVVEAACWYVRALGDGTDPSGAMSRLLETVKVYNAFLEERVI